MFADLHNVRTRILSNFYKFYFGRQSFIEISQIYLYLTIVLDIFSKKIIIPLWDLVKSTPCFCEKKICLVNLKELSVCVVDIVIVMILQRLGEDVLLMRARFSKSKLNHFFWA